MRYTLSGEGPKSEHPSKEGKRVSLMDLEENAFPPSVNGFLLLLLEHHIGSSLGRFYLSYISIPARPHCESSTRCFLAPKDDFRTLVPIYDTLLSNKEFMDASGRKKAD